MPVRQDPGISPKKGFTLIELMVAISIIAILAAVGLVAYSTAQKAGRISKRIQDLKAIQTALESYKAANPEYPKSFNPGGGTVWRSECSGYNASGTITSSTVIPGLVPLYMANFPSDPSMDISLTNNCYLYSSNGIDYKILDYRLVDMTDAEMGTQPQLIDPTRPSGGSRSWTIYTGGARTW